MMIGLLAFFGAVTLGFAVAALLTREVFRAVFSLLGSLCGVAAMIAVMGATTIASLQLLIYVGGIFVLFLFGILVTERPVPGMVFRPGAVVLMVSLLLASGFLVVLGLGVFDLGAAEGTRSWHLYAADLGASFVREELLTFEAVSVLLLVGLVAAITVARKELAGND